MPPSLSIPYRLCFYVNDRSRGYVITTDTRKHPHRLKQHFSLHVWFSLFMMYFLTTHTLPQTEIKCTNTSLDIKILFIIHVLHNVLNTLSAVMLPIKHSFIHQRVYLNVTLQSLRTKMLGFIFYSYICTKTCHNEYASNHPRFTPNTARYIRLSRISYSN